MINSSSGLFTHESSYIANLRMDERTNIAFTAFMSLSLLVDTFAVGLCIGAKLQLSKWEPPFYHHQGIFLSCDYQSQLALAFSALALLYLLASIAIITAGSRCLVYGEPSKLGAAHTIANTFFILKWLSSMVAAACLLLVLQLNIKPGYGTFTVSCEEASRGKVDAGIGFAFFSLISSVSYYICYVKARKEVTQTHSSSPQSTPLLTASV